MLHEHARTVALALGDHADVEHRVEQLIHRGDRDDDASTEPDTSKLVTSSPTLKTRVVADRAFLSSVRSPARCAALAGFARPSTRTLLVSGFVSPVAPVAVIYRTYAFGYAEEHVPISVGGLLPIDV